MTDPIFIIAEAGVNHNGDIGRARELIDVAAESGADAVKFQTFEANLLVTADAPRAQYQSESGGSESQLELLQGLELSWAEFEELFDHCRRRKIEFMSTPFDIGSADRLERLGMHKFKIPSGELTHHEFIRHVASKGKPVIVSTGMATLREVVDAVEVVHAAGCIDLTVLHCVSAYPAPLEDMNLRAMLTLRESLQVPTGLSDHSLGITVPIAAAALGAVCIEKHFTLDKSLPGPDHQASLDPQELAAMVAAIRDVEKALGTGVKTPADSEGDTASVARRSVVLSGRVTAGHVLVPEDLIIRRPGTGLPPSERTKLIGRRVKIALNPGHLISWSDVE